MVDKTKEIINDLNIQYSSNYNMSFEKAYSKYIQPNDHLAKKREKLNIIRDVRDDIEAQWKENSVERFVRYISSFFIYCSPKIMQIHLKPKRKKKTSYVYFCLSIIAIIAVLSIARYGWQEQNT